MREEAPDPERKPAISSKCTCSWGLKTELVSSVHPLVTRSPSTVRFVSGLTLTSPHCVLRTVIHGRVLVSQAVHLQIQRVLAVVSGDGESALHRVRVACATSIIANTCDPLQPVPWSLAYPAHAIATEGESRGCTGESQGPARLHQVSPRLHQLHLTLDTCRHKTSWSGNCHTTTLSLTHILSYTQCFLFTINYLLKEQQGKPSQVQTPW